MNESNKSQQSDSAISLINLPVSMKLRLNWQKKPGKKKLYFPLVFVPYAKNEEWT